MNSLEKLKYLFVDVKERLPESNKDVLCLTKHQRKVVSSTFKAEDGQLYFDNDHIDNDDGVTHWLDLSQLTTKKLALELAVDFAKANDNMSNESAEWRHYTEKHLYNFIGENKDKL